MNNNNYIQNLPEWIPKDTISETELIEIRENNSEISVLMDYFGKKIPFVIIGVIY